MAVWLLTGALTCAPVSVWGQAGTPNPVEPAAVSFRVLDMDRLFQGSALGQRLLAELRTAESQLESENQALFDQLATEERALTDARATLSPEEFRARADAFDTRVESIRAERAERARDIARLAEGVERAFREAVLPVLRARMDEAGIDAILPPDALILGPEWLDITANAIAWLDAAHPATQP